MELLPLAASVTTRITRGWATTMRISLGSVLISFLAITACSGEPPAPSASDVSSANIGAYPSNYEQIIKSYYSQRLIDPASATYGPMSAPRRGYLRPYFAGGTTAAPIIGYVVCGTVNSKNRLGGYVGAKPFAIVITNDAVAYAELPTIQCG